ncbi:hypothetical protein HAX42_14390 [Enterococcus casseliflavus]|nr:hypothetical protein [Enterococcus casseliflavus]
MNLNNCFTLEIMDSELLSSLTDSPNLEKYETGHDILEVQNEAFALQVWVNKMYGQAEVECNFGKKVNVNNQTGEYEFDYLDSADFVEACKDIPPMAVALGFFLSFLTHYEGV